MQVLVWLFSFAAAFALVLAAGAVVRRALERHPDLLALYRTEQGELGRLGATWQLSVRLAARELPGTALRKTREQVATDLLRAGKPSELTAEVFLGRAVLEGVGVAVASSIFTMLLLGKPMVLLAVGLGAVFSLGIRPHMLHAEAEGRTNRINRSLAYAIDLAVLVLGAGGTLREALELISQNAENDPLAEEVAIALQQIHTGTPQAKAFIEMADRVQLEEMTTLVTAINRGEETGAPMVRALEGQSEVFRYRRLQRAERIAVEAPVKMMFPNMIIMLAVLLIVLGPVFIKLAQEGGF